MILAYAILVATCMAAFIYHDKMADCSVTVGDILIYSGMAICPGFNLVSLYLCSAEIVRFKGWMRVKVF